ncbi:MAG TPA: mechanosensitive ion channel family protein [Chthoniobacterales bacterium]|jgi:small-conductance mechanosensitive channel|nr:mechanosensitive ion channel family protein [Chthoniobacterales bacterium]
MLELFQTQRAILTVVIFIATYFVSLTIGRLLKRRAGVGLGVLFQLFCLTLAFYAAMWFYGVKADWRNHVGAALFLLSTALFVALLDRYLWDLYWEKKRRATIPTFLRQVVALFIYLIALLLVLSVGYHAQAELRGLLAGSGIAAIVLGFATQDLFGGIIAGIALQISKPYKVGDWLNIEQKFAEVMEINWRSTRLRTNDGIYLDIPNYQIARNTIINLHYPTEIHAMRLRVGADYDVPPNRVKDALHRAAITAEGVLPDPPVKVFVMDFADSAVIYEIKFSMGNHRGYNEVCDAIRTNIWYEFKRQQIAIPFPIRTLHLQRGSKRAGDAQAEARVILRNEALFECMNDDQLETVLKQSQIHRYGRGERLIQEGDEGDSMFVMLRGTAAVSIARNGTSVRVGAMRQGDCFGEFSLLTGEPRSATVRAENDCEVLEISKPVMADLLRESPDCLNALSELLAKRKLEGEGIVRDAMVPRAHEVKETEYRSTFLRRLRTVFEL